MNKKKRAGGIRDIANELERMHKKAGSYREDKAKEDVCNILGTMVSEYLIFKQLEIEPKYEYLSKYQTGVQIFLEEVRHYREDKNHARSKQFFKSYVEYLMRGVEPDVGVCYSVSRFISQSRIWADQIEKEPDETEISKPPKEPSKEENQAYNLHWGTGWTQEKVAEFMSKELGVHVSQGQISKWVNGVKTWLNSRNLPIEKKASPPITIDPAKLDMGVRTDGQKTGDVRHKRD